MEFKRTCRPAPNAFRVRLLHIEETMCGNMSQTVHDAIRLHKPDGSVNLLIYIMITDYSKMLSLQAT